MEDLGLNPDENKEDMTTPIGIGNLCGNNVVKSHLDDGINQVSKMKPQVISNWPKEFAGNKSSKKLISS